MNQYPYLTRYMSSLCKIPGGEFHRIVRLRGKDGLSHVRVRDFKLGKTPVTWGLWLEYCESTKTKHPDSPGWEIDLDDPVVNVSWQDIMKTNGFCTWVARETGIQVSLPSQCQWEYAATAGNIKNIYPWGARFDSKKLWCSVEKQWDAKRTASTIRTERIHYNQFRIADLVGNVGQWCFDFYTPDTDAELLPSAVRRKLLYRVIKGGGWHSNHSSMLNTRINGWNHYQYCNDHTGFRLMAEPEHNRR